MVVRDIFVANGFSGRHIIEPYAGSAAVSLGLLDFGLVSRVTLMERDPLLYSLWKSVFFHFDEFVEAYLKLPITLDTWRKFQPLLKLDQPDSAHIVEMGVAALFFNRANFSGIMNAGPIGGKGQVSSYKIDCRTNKDDIVARLWALSMLSDKVDVQFGDAIDLIKEYSNRTKDFFYLDPPYFNKGESLYRYYYGLKQHKALAAALSEAKFRWLLSYDDHHVIEFLYSDFYRSRQRFRYSARAPKNHSELLISNFPVTLPDGGSVELPRRQRHWSSRQERVS